MKSLECASLLAPFVQSIEERVIEQLSKAAASCRSPSVLLQIIEMRFAQ
jgi:hypothetical protein